MSPNTENFDSSIRKSLQACDLCHARKIKCDRQNQCQNCTTIGARCDRLRRKRKRRGRRLGVPSPDNTPTQLWPRGEECNSGRSVPGSPRSNRRCVPNLETMPTPSDQTEYTGNLIQQELNSSATLSPDRVWVLESAIAFLGNYMTSSPQVDEAEPELVLDDATSATNEIPSELFYLMFVGQSGTPMSPHHWPDHISSQLLQQMCMALANHAISGQSAIQHKVCVFHKATMYISRLLRFCDPGFMSDALQKSQRAYAAACLKHLREVDLISNPSIGTLQALLSGASLVLLLGRTSQAWTLTALASRILVALGFHTASRESLVDETKSHIRHCISWCFYLDKTLSMLLFRPSSLPRLPWAPAALVPITNENPLIHKAQIFIRLAQVQDVCLSLIFNASNMDGSSKSGTVEDLESELQDILQSVTATRDEWMKTAELKLEWVTLNFTVYAVLTAVLRLDTASLHNQTKREKCLLCARRALLTMQEFQANITRSVTTDFFSWTVLMYPLTPFFVVFCNVVATSDLQDLELLTQVTAIMSQIKEQCKLSMNLFKMFTQFVQLCGHLNDVQLTRKQLNAVQTGQKDRAEPNITRHGSIGNGSLISVQPTQSDATKTIATPAVDSQPLQSTDLCPDQTASLGGQTSETVWDDALVWQLFDMQPSIESFDLTLFDLDLDML